MAQGPCSQQRVSEHAKALVMKEVWWAQSFGEEGLMRRWWRVLQEQGPFV